MLNEKTRLRPSQQEAREGLIQRWQREPLASQASIPQRMPALLGTGDLVVLFLLNVFWVTNVTPIAAAGPVAFLYWIGCGALFFIPCSLVMAQLATFFPYEGSIYNWTYYALGRGWSFFVGICTWLPGVLSMVNAAAATVSSLQALNPRWLLLPWQQGVIILGILGFAGVLSLQRTRIVQQVMNVAMGAMGLATILISAAALVWLVRGHSSLSAIGLAPSSGAFPEGPPLNLGLVGNATLALLGSNMPLALAGEVKAPSALRHHLTWGTLLTLGGYLLFTFALLVVEGAQATATTVNPMSLLFATVERVFGPIAGNVMELCVLFYFLLIPVALNLCFARLLLVAGNDQRISAWFAHLNRHAVPTHALLAQISIAILFACVLYFVLPAITFLGDPAALTSEAYNVLGASLLLVWAVSFMFPFIDLAALYLRDTHTFHRQRVLPLPVLGACVITGPLLCLLSIVATLLNSFIPTLIPNGIWWYLVGGSTCACLLLCALGAMLTNSEARWEALH